MQQLICKVCERWNDEEPIYRVYVWPHFLLGTLANAADMISFVHIPARDGTPEGGDSQSAPSANNVAGVLSQAWPAPDQAHGRIFQTRYTARSWTYRSITSLQHFEAWSSAILSILF